MTDQKVRTCWWFESDGLAAAELYVSLLPDSQLDGHYVHDAGPPMVVEFTLAGSPMMALNGGPGPTHSWAASFSVLTEDQAETDRLWQALTANGGEESRCGWLKDRWGISWQITPRRLRDMMASSDRPAALRARDAMLTMSKIDIAALETAFNNQGDPA